MSALFGIYSIEGKPVDQARLSSMSEVLAHRGPDNYGQWVQKSIGLGHRLLRTTPESAREKLPYFCVETGIGITTDCRLDDREALIDIIGRNNFKTDIIPDSLIIIKSYLKWQDRCAEHLLGDFSFVIWDKKKQKLFCARDQLGIKPFYYYFENGEFIFCSESGPIARHCGINAPINEVRIGDHLTPHLEGFDKTSTFFTNIHRLPPAHTLVIEHGQLKKQQYWTPTAKPIQGLSHDRDYQEAFTEIITRAVADRCRGIGRPGVLLSGGIDSASIMGLARDFCKDRGDNNIYTYSGISEDIDNCRESRMIQILTGTEKIVPFLYTPKDLDREADAVLSLIAKIQEPFDIGMPLLFALYRKAAQDGTKVMLDGVDGDVLTSLSPSYPAQLFKKGAFISGVRETMLQSREYYEKYYSVPTLLFRYLRSAATPYLIKEWRFRRNIGKEVEKIVNESIISDNFAEKIQFSNRLQTFEKQHRSKSLSFPQGHYINNILHPFLTVGIERYDRIASLCSIEPRHPLADRRVVEFFAALPWNQIVRNGWSKYLLRKMAEQHLPPKICWRAGNEHVGWSFTETLINRKLKKLNRFISKRYRKIGTITNYNIAIQDNNAYTIDEATNNKSHLLNVAGLAMWLENL